MSHPPPDRPTLTFPSEFIPLLKPYLPTATSSQSTTPHITLTYATSLDSTLSLSRTIPTVLSGPLSKALTHYLRSTHSAILVGAGTAIADDPALNCRIAGVGLELQPRPIVVDPKGRWNFKGSKAAALAEKGEGKSVWVIRGLKGGEEADWEVVACGGKVIRVGAGKEGAGLDWKEVFLALGTEGIASVMIEGGGYVINDLWEKGRGLLDSVIVTIAPVYLGDGGVAVCPRREGDGSAPVGRLKSVKWIPMGEDVVVCGKP